MIDELAQITRSLSEGSLLRNGNSLCAPLSLTSILRAIKLISLLLLFLVRKRKGELPRIAYLLFTFSFTPCFYFY